MPDSITRMEDMLFDYQTTYRTDYRSFELKPPVFTKFQEKPMCLAPRGPPLKDIHTLSAWKEGVVIPFSLLHRPRRIFNTNPQNMSDSYSKIEETDRRHAIKTRPRLVMTPAVSMDDITNPRAREILCREMYTSSMKKSTREAVSNFVNVKAPLLGHYTQPDPVALPKLKLPYVSPEWRMDSVTWDQKQLRTHCDTTREFFLRKRHPNCRPCIDSVKIQTYRKRMCQLMTQKKKLK